MSKSPEAWNSPLLDAILAQITPKQQEKVAIKLRVATRIGNLLDERGLQKKQLAEQCELKGASMVTKWLSGGHNFTLDTLVDIAAVLGVSVADLVRPMENGPWEPPIRQANRSSCMARPNTATPDERPQAPVSIQHQCY
jgi:transcriptional regulator with XRE-family HTH domain